MSGIYIHIPFCKRRCFYCDFYKTTQTRSIPRFVNKLVEEAGLRARLFAQQKVETIYFGGGTPGLLGINDLTAIVNALSRHFNLKPNVEFTLEVNPDDISLPYLKALRQLAVNRLSIGIQSFFDDDLEKMGRRHNGVQSKQAIELAFQAGFENVSTDLIYGLPWGTAQKVEANIEAMTAFPVHHISAYHLSIEPGTVFGRRKRRGLLHDIPDLESERLFWLVSDRLKEQGFEHYEISNFCRHGKYSLHNTRYWSGASYLGLGPGAHSFHNGRRFWNRPDLKSYLTSDLTAVEQSETLTAKDIFNERVMLGLRTSRGVDEEALKARFPEYHRKVQPLIDKWVMSGHLRHAGRFIAATRKGWFVADGIIEDLFLL